MTQSSNLQLNDADLELLSAYIDSQLANDERAALEERLRREPALRAALDELRATVVLLHELEPVKPPRSFTLDPQIYQPPRTSLFARLNLGPALTVLALAFLCVAVFTVRGLLPGRQVAYGPSAPAAAATVGGAEAFIAAATAAPGGGGLATAAPPPPEVALGSAATSAPAFDAGGSVAQATAEPPAAMAPAAAAAATVGPAAPAEVTAAPAAAEATAAPPPATAAPAAAAEAPTEQRALAQQPSILPATPGEAYPPIATSGSTSSNTTYIPPQPVSSPAAGQAPASAGQNPITLLIGVPLMLLLIIGLLWLRRRR